MSQPFIHLDLVAPESFVLLVSINETLPFKLLPSMATVHRHFASAPQLRSLKGVKLPQLSFQSQAKKLFYSDCSDYCPGYGGYSHLTHCITEEEMTKREMAKREMTKRPRTAGSLNSRAFTEMVTQLEVLRAIH